MPTTLASLTLNGMDFWNFKYLEDFLLPYTLEPGRSYAIFLARESLREKFSDKAIVVEIKNQIDALYKANFKLQNLQWR